MRKFVVLLGGLALTACVVNVQRGRGQQRAANDPPPASTAPAATPAVAPEPTTTAPPAATTATPAPTSTGPGATGVMMPFQELPEPPPSDPPIDVKLVDADGRPAGLVAGANLGVWIWIDKDQTWHVRTTTHSQSHRFQGVVMTTRDNTMTDVKPTRLEMNDRLRTRNGRIAVWDFTTNGHEDGFDFKSVGGQCLRFFVQVDGHPEPAAINIGKAAAHPSKWHFRLCP